MTACTSLLNHIHVPVRIWFHVNGIILAIIPFSQGFQALFCTIQYDNIIIAIAGCKHATTIQTGISNDNQLKHSTIAILVQIRTSWWKTARWRVGWHYQDTLRNFGQLNQNIAFFRSINTPCIDLEVVNLVLWSQVTTHEPASWGCKWEGSLRPTVYH